MNSTKKSSGSTLVIMPHPDDAELACGGSVAKWVGEGDVYYVIASDGGKGSWNENEAPYTVSCRREDEQKKAADYLGVKKVVFLQHSDGELENIKTLRVELAALIRKFKPYRIVTNDPWTRMFHPDHRANAFAVIGGIMIARDWHFYPFLKEIGLKPARPEKLLLAPTDNPNFVVDITDTIDKKTKDICFHESQFTIKEGWEKNLRDWSREIAKDSNFEYGEAFYDMPL
ncbi:MAG: PIG-L family deacetylase [candidate division WOR-3 bacterium]